jgi:hypothetical protein
MQLYRIFNLSNGVRNLISNLADFDHPALHWLTFGLMRDRTAMYHSKLHVVLYITWLCFFHQLFRLFVCDIAHYTYHLRKPSVRFAYPNLPLAEFTYFLRLQIVVFWVLQAPIRSRLTDMFILSIVGLHGKPSLSLLLRKERRTISSTAFGVYE